MVFESIFNKILDLVERQIEQVETKTNSRIKVSRLVPYSHIHRPCSSLVVSALTNILESFFAEN